MITCFYYPKKKKCNSTSLQFGGVTLHREIIRKDIVKRPEEDSHDGMIRCADEAPPAVCGIRAIWVTPNRRKHIASSLLDAARDKLSSSSSKHNS
ncbi:hypothetical protein ACS0TY_031325 [Phlomoides rotata]